MGVVLTAAQIRKLPPAQQAIIAEAEAEMHAALDTGYSVSDVVCMSMNSGNFEGYKRTEVKDMLVDACASAVLECTKRGRADYDICRESFAEWLQDHRPVPEEYETPAPVAEDWGPLIRVALGIGAIIWACCHVSGSFFS